MDTNEAASTISRSTHFVVLDDGVGKWKKGDVLRSSILSAAGAELARLLALKAIRPASEYESLKSHVDLTSPEKHLSYDHLLAEKDRRIAQLTTRVASLEEQIAAGLHLTPTVITPEGSMHQESLLRAKDQAIRDLEIKLAAAKIHMGAAEAEVDSLRKDATKKNESVFDGVACDEEAEENCKEEAKAPAATEAVVNKGMLGKSKSDKSDKADKSEPAGVTLAVGSPPELPASSGQSSRNRRNS